MTGKAKRNRKLVCAYCGEPHSSLNPITKDHIVPRARNGEDSSDNILMACMNCNRLKGDGDYEDFRSLVRNVKDRQATASGLASATERYKAIQTHVSRNMRRVSLHILSGNNDLEEWLDSALVKVPQNIRSEVKGIFLIMQLTILEQSVGAYLRAQEKNIASITIPPLQRGEPETVIEAPQKKRRKRKTSSATVKIRTAQGLDMNRISNSEFFRM